MDPAATQRQPLHRGGMPGSWGRLGCWPAPHHAGACRTMALAVGAAAGLQPGDTVLSLACGAGDELLLWAGHCGAGRVLGVEIDPAAAALAQARVAGLPGSQVLCCSALAMDGIAVLDGPFAAIVCVDAAYHLAPRDSFLTTAGQRLRPGGRAAGWPAAI